MTPSIAWSLQAYRRQHLLVEFASLKHVKLRGVYATITPGNPALWRCVLFVRKGPYNGALLTFRIYFSDEYPFELPIIVFERDIFHPLVIGAEVDQDDDVFVEVTQKTASRTAETKPTGHFNLKSGLRNMAKDVSNYAEEGRISIIDILLHIRACFDDRRIIDEIHLQDIVNIAAWQAWQAHNEHLKDENNQELNEKDVWQQEMDSLIERSSNIKPEDMFEEVKHNNDSLSKQHGSDDAPGAD